jgi:hypothetical protein
MERDRQPLTRRRVLQGMGTGVVGMSVPAWAQQTFDFKIPGGPSVRPITTSFPEKGRMILQRTSPPWLETPFDIYDKSVITPNNQHYVSWHWATYPDQINVDTFRLAVHGEVDKALSLSLKDIQGLPQFEIVAVLLDVNRLPCTRCSEPHGQAGRQGLPAHPGHRQYTAILHYERSQWRQAQGGSRDACPRHRLRR